MDFDVSTTAVPRRRFRWPLRFGWSITCFALAGAISLIAILDHRAKQQRLNAAQVREWYCVNIGTHCGGPSSAEIERHWQWRQYGYEAFVALVSGVGLVSFGYRLAKP
jgi:hypothetical protein